MNYRSYKYLNLKPSFTPKRIAIALTTFFDEIKLITWIMTTSFKDYKKYFRKYSDA